MGLIAALVLFIAAANSQVDGDNVKIPKHDQPGQYHVIPAHK